MTQRERELLIALEKLHQLVNGTEYAFSGPNVRASIVLEKFKGVPA